MRKIWLSSFFDSRCTLRVVLRYRVTLYVRLRRMFDVVDLPLCWPVEVNYHEAKAFCAWSGPDYRLLAEAEYHALHAPPVFRRFF